MPAPAWYPDPGSAHHVRWWDGTAWTDHVNVAPPLPVIRRGLGKGWFTLARWTQLALASCATVGAVEAAAMWWARGESIRYDEDPAAGGSGFIVRMIGWDGYTTLAGGALMTVTGILFIIWLYRAATSDLVLPQELRWRPGWAIGGWFVPIVFLFVPARIVNDVRRSALRRSGTAEQTGAALVSWWWAAWLMTNALSIASAATDPFPPVGDGATPSDLTTYSTVTAAYGAASVFAALLGMFVVARITDSVRAGRPQSRPS